MKLQYLLFFIISSFIMGSQAAHGTTLAVPLQYPTIQEALSQAQPNDRIEIAPGYYSEWNLTIPEGITLSGTGSRADEVTIDAMGQGRIFLCESLVETTTIQNISFIHGVATGQASYDQSGGAILLSNSNVSIINCIFINNVATSHGGAIRCTHSSPQIIGCYFEANRANDGGGGAVDCSYDSHPNFEDCFFRNNEANWGGAISCRGDASPTLAECNFDSNQALRPLGYGGAIMTDFVAQPSFFKCTFYNNSARFGGAMASFEDSQPNLDYCTIVGNSSVVLGAGIVCSKSEPIVNNSIIAFQEGFAFGCVNLAQPRISCTNIFGNSEGDWLHTIADQLGRTGNMSADPLFCDPASDDIFQFNLQSDSPCGDESSSCSLMGAWSGSCGTTPSYINNFTAIWVDEVPRISWHVVSSKADAEFVLMRSSAAHPSDGHAIPFHQQSDGLFVSVDNDLQPERNLDYLYRLFLVQEDGDLSLANEILLGGLDMLKPLHLIGAWPNPFNPRTTISFEIAHQKLVKATVHDIGGRLVARLAQEVFPAGMHELVWNGNNSQGHLMESGTYFVVVQSEGLIRSQKVLLLK